MIKNDLKIIQVIDTLSVGGAENVFVDTCNLLYNNEVDISALFILKKGLLGHRMNSNIPIFELNRKNKWSIVKMKLCSEIVKKHSIIHCHSRHNYRYIKIVSILFNVKSKIIFHEHSSNLKIPRFFNSFLQPEFIISVSSEMASAFKEKMDILDKNIFILSNSVRKISKLNAVKYDSFFDFVLVSNFKKNKNIKFVIDLIHELNASLLLIGQKSDINYFNEIIGDIKKNQINVEIKENVDSVQEFLTNAKMGLHASMKETGPLVLIEYLAQGLPFLAYETGEVSQIIKKYYPEFFINNLNIEEWKRRILFIQNKNYNPIDLQNVYEEHFNQEIYYKNLMNIYLCIKS